MERLFYLIYLSAITTIATAQAPDSLPRKMADVVLKFAPLSLLDPDATVQGGLEYFIRSNASVQAEFGYGTPVMQLGGFGPAPWTANSHVNGKTVWRIRAECRHYLFSQRVQGVSHFPNCGPYVALEGMYKQINVMQLDTVQGGETITPVFVRAPVSRHVIALHGKVGAQIKLDYNPNSFWGRFLIDIYAGAGIRYIRVVTDDSATISLFTNSALYDRFAYTLYRPGDHRWRPSATLGFKVCFTL